MKTPLSSILSPNPHQNIVLVTDWITKEGGGEKVVEQFHLTFPEAPIYTSYCAERWRGKLDDKVVTGYLQHWPFSSLRRFLPVLRQHWFAHLDLSEYDVIISITGNGEAKFVRPNYISLRKRLLRLLRLSPLSSTPTHYPLHISYCHTPVHFYWKHYDSYIEQPSMRPKWLARLGLRLLVKPLRNNDYAAAQRVDYFIANSSAIQQDIMTYYGRESEIIYPPIKVDKFIHLSPRGKTRIIPQKPQCIWWGRVVPAKRLDIAIEVCNQLQIPFTIIGDGPDIDRLKRLAGPTIQFLGYLSDQDREKFIRAADLFLFPAYEDFGVAPVEALAAGIPLVAYRAGGALDYVIDQKTGMLFDDQNTESMAQTLQQTIGKSFSIEEIQASVRQYSVQYFSDQVNKFVQKHTEETA